MNLLTRTATHATSANLRAAPNRRHRAAHGPSPTRTRNIGGGGGEPGLILTAVIAGVSFALRQLPGVSTFSPMILAIGIGMGTTM